MLTVEFLQAIRKSDKQLIATQLKLEQLKGQLENIELLFDRDNNAEIPFFQSNTIIGKFTDLYHLYLKDLNHWLEVRQQAEAFKAALTDDRFKLLIDTYYIAGLSFEKSAEELDYSEKQLRRINTSLLKYLSELAD